MLPATIPKREADAHEGPPSSVAPTPTSTLTDQTVASIVDTRAGSRSMTKRAAGTVPSSEAGDATQYGERSDASRRGGRPSALARCTMLAGVVVQPAVEVSPSATRRAAPSPCVARATTRRGATRRSSRPRRARRSRASEARRRSLRTSRGSPRWTTARSRGRRPRSGHSPSRLVGACSVDEHMRCQVRALRSPGRRAARSRSAVRGTLRGIRGGAGRCPARAPRSA